MYWFIFQMHVYVFIDTYMSVYNINTAFAPWFFILSKFPGSLAFAGGYFAPRWGQRWLLENGFCLRGLRRGDFCRGAFTAFRHFGRGHCNGAAVERQLYWGRGNHLGLFSGLGGRMLVFIHSKPVVKCSDKKYPHGVNCDWLGGKVVLRGLSQEGL